MNDGNTPPGSISIRFLSGPLAEQSFPIRKPIVTIGRGENNDIVVRSDQKVSRIHARLRWNGASWSVEKLAPQNTLSVMQSSILLLFTAFMEPLHQGVFLPVGLEVLTTFVLSSLAGLALGLAISAVSSNSDSATSFIPMILLPMVIFAGVIIPLKDWPLQVPAMLFPTRWAMIALRSSLGVHSETTGKDSLIGSAPSYHGTLFSIYSQSDATQRILLAWACLGGIILLLLITIGLALKAKDVRK